MGNPHWRRVGKPYAYHLGPYDFLISREDAQSLQDEMNHRPVDFSLHWLIRRPGGRVGDQTFSVRFYSKQSAMMFKLARIV